MCQLQLLGGFDDVSGKFYFDVMQDTFRHNASGNRSLANILGFPTEAPIRITSLASPQLILSRLEQCFGKSEAFTLETAAQLQVACSSALDMVLMLVSESNG